MHNQYYFLPLVIHNSFVYAKEPGKTPKSTGFYFILLYCGLLYSFVIMATVFDFITVLLLR